MLQLLVRRLSNSALIGGPVDSSISDRFSEDIEAETNSYFHKLFSGHLSIDAVVQMLAQFHDSQEKRYGSCCTFKQITFFCLFGEGGLGLRRELG